MGKYKYLGKRVRDIKQKGLDTLTEASEIARLIERDYRDKRITYATAIRRLNLLILLLKGHDKKLAQNYSRAERMKVVDEIEEYKERIRRLEKKRKGRKKKARQGGGRRRRK